MSKVLHRCLAGVAAVVVIAGCASSDSTNLTPRRLPQDRDGYYHFETTWQSNRRGVGTNVAAFVILDTELFPMKPVPFTRNRYEAFVPLPPGKTYIPYRYRFDYDYPGARMMQRTSDMSPSYRLIVPMDGGAPESNQR